MHIDRMRNQQDQLQKKLKEEADRKIKMEKDMQKQQHKIKELEDNMNQQQKILKRKTEEVAAAKRRLRSVGKQGSEEKERYDITERGLCVKDLSAGKGTAFLSLISVREIPREVTFQSAFKGRVGSQSFLTVAVLSFELYPKSKK